MFTLLFFDIYHIPNPAVRPFRINQPYTLSALCCISLGQFFSFPGEHGSTETMSRCSRSALNKEIVGWGSPTVAPRFHNLPHNNHMVSHLHTLVFQNPASHPPRSALALLQPTITIRQATPNIVPVEVSNCGFPLHEGVGNLCVFEATRGEFEGGFDGKVGARGEFDVE